MPARMKNIGEMAVRQEFARNIFPNDVKHMILNSCYAHAWAVALGIMLVSIDKHKYIL